ARRRGGEQRLPLLAHRRLRPAPVVKCRTGLASARRTGARQRTDIRQSVTYDRMASRPPSPRPPVSAARVRFDCLITPPEAEAAFRRQHAVSDRNLARFCVLVTACGCALFILNDYLLLADGTVFALVLACRAAFIALSVWLLLRRTVGDGLFLAWCLCTVAQN